MHIVVGHGGAQKSDLGKEIHWVCWVTDGGDWVPGVRIGPDCPVGRGSRPSGY